MLSRVALVALSGLLAGMPQNDRPIAVPPDRILVARVPQNPLITVKSSPSLGDNVNGPSVIRLAPWVKAPLGRYYMYFAHHYGRFIRLAYADSVTGPWKIYEPGAAH